MCYYRGTCVYPPLNLSASLWFGHFGDALSSMKAAATDAGSSSAAPALDLASRLTENAEIVSECLAVLQQLVPQLSAEERVLVATQHPYATPAWLDSLTALSRGQLSDDLLLIVDLERELANCQVLASTRTRQLVEQKSSRGEAGQGHGACLASADESAAAPSRAAHAAENGEQREEVLVEPQQQQLLRRQQQEKQKLLQREQQLLQQQRQQQQREQQLLQQQQLEAAAAAAEAAAEAEAAEEEELKQRRAAYEALGEGSCLEDDDDIDEERRKRRSEGKFDSISEEIAALNAGIISEPSTVDAVDERVECKFCARKFAPERLERHMVICQETKKNAAYRSAVKK